MIFNETKLKGAFIIEVEKRVDHRGYFTRTFCVDEFKKHELAFEFVQGNMSYTLKKNTLRGMHYQMNGAEEVKLVRCTKGSILDVIVDLRKGSSTYGQYISIELSEDNLKQIYVPREFAHGFLTLTDHVEVSYLVSAFYSPGKEKGIRWDDPFFDIKWPTDNPVLSEKDANFDNYKRTS